MKLLPKIIIISILLLAIGINPSCDKQEYVPYVYVNVQLYPDMPAHSALKTPGNYVYVDGAKELVPQEKKSELAVKVSDRHFGIGSDGLIFINPVDILQDYSSNALSAVQNSTFSTVHW